MTLKALLNRRWLRGAGLIIAIPALAFLLWRSDEPLEPVGAKALRGPTEPDSFVVNARFLSFDEQGRLASAIASPRIERFDARTLTTLRDPQARIYDRETGVPWTITASQGELRESDSTLTLEEDVLIQRPLTRGGEGRIATRTLTLNNAERTAYTDAPILITDRFSTTEAVGMKAWIDDRIIDLHNDVETFYDPANTGAAP